MPPGVEVINIDLLAGRDMLNDGLFSYALQITQSKLLLALLAGPPYRTVSVLRTRDDGGPRVLRPGSAHGQQPQPSPVGLS